MDFRDFSDNKNIYLAIIATILIVFLSPLLPNVTFWEFLTLFQSIIAIISIIPLIHSFREKNKKNEKKNEPSKLLLSLCKDFQTIVIPYYIGIINYHSKNHLNIIGYIQVDKKKGITIKPQEMKKKYDSFIQKVLVLFNEMNMFATEILEKYKDEEFQAYRIQGHAYCDIINHLNCIYPLFLMTNEDDYHNLSELYNIWSTRLSKLREDDPSSS